MLSITTKRPRNLDSPRAAAILYGDWGTSKAYVIGLAFAVAGYSSFWLIAAMCLLTALVGVNYMAICKHYPDGGGVYASVRHRSEIVSIVGAFLLIADYIVTAALSALSAFQYLGVQHPEYWAAGAIMFIGALNYFGPKHTGGLAFLVSLPTVVVVVLLAIFCLPHLGQAWHNVQPLTGGFAKNWNGFVGVVLALSGVEAIANATGVMKLNRDSTPEKPNVSRTSTPAIIWVMVEVCALTALLGLAMHALPNLVHNKDDVDAVATATMPESPGVRDYMLRYMAQVFVGQSFAHTAVATSMAWFAGWAVSIVFGVLLLSAVNTAIVDLIAISFLMSRDGELPQGFQKLNTFGVPTMGIIVATIIPAILVIAVKDMAGLADLYAVGVVGAIATNLGASSTDKKLGLERWERTLMFCTFLIMLAIELSLFVDKPNARYFSFTVLVFGLILRGLAAESSARKRKKDAEAANETEFLVKPDIAVPKPAADATDSLTGAPIMCAVRGIGRTLDFAIEEAREMHRPLYVLFVRSLPVITQSDLNRKWQSDDEARTIFAYAFEKAEGHPVLPCYTVSDAPADTIVELAATTGATHLILGAPTRRGLTSLLSGDVVAEVSRILPEEIHLLIYA
jgi:amino acid transporter/nucleotide-binding universal stress UspA family protein